MDTKSHKIAGVGVLVALAMVLSYLESLIPISLGIPGIKLGLSNVVTLFALYQFGGGIAFGVAVCRIVLCGVTFGSLSTMLYSFAGGLLSFAVMFVLKNRKVFDIWDQHCRRRDAQCRAAFGCGIRDADCKNYLLYAGSSYCRDSGRCGNWHIRSDDLSQDRYINTRTV